MDHIKLKPEIKALWLKALRSGDYKQVKRSLRTKEGFCCLGVLCDISGEGEWAKHGDLNRYLSKNGNYYKTMPPFSVYGWALNKYSNSVLSTLAEMNDAGASFNTIANYIEKNF